MIPRLHVEAYGEKGPLLAVCNGLSQSTANWRALARQHGQFRWLLFDARGHGKSEAGEGVPKLDHHVDDLLRVLERQGDERAFLVGFSHGARVALRAAASYPDRFRGAILVSCAARTTPRRRAHLLAWEHCLRLGGPAALAWASLPNIVGRKILERYPDLEMLVKGTVARNQEAGLKAVLAGMKDYPPPREDAERVRLPVLLVRGGEDGLVDAEDLALFQTWMPDARVFQIDDCGHTLPLEEPAAFIGALETFTT